MSRDDLLHLVNPSADSGRVPSADDKLRVMKMKKKDSEKQKTRQGESSIEISNTLFLHTY